MFESRVKALLDIPESSIKKLEKSLVEKVPEESFLTDSLD